MQLENKYKIGFLVNPIAGMGGSVGLKGTDDGLHHRAIQLGASPVAPYAATKMLSNIKSASQIHFITAPGKMGADYLDSFGFEKTEIGAIKDNTTSEDTIRIAKSMVHAEVDLIVFVGGDGTARNIFDGVGTVIPVIAVPSGVKVYSAVFAFNPRDAASLLDQYISGSDLTEKEVLDIDEDAFRQHRLSSHLYGFMNVPEVGKFTQPGKSSYGQSPSENEEKQAIAEEIIETMADETLYFLGPGTTIKPIAERLSISSVSR